MPVVPPPPSGRQIEPAWADQRAVVVEVGGGLRTYAAGGREIVDGYGPQEMCSGGRGQLLLPWPNRIGGGRYRFGGTDMQLPLTEPERGNAIHGLSRWARGRARRGHPVRRLRALDRRLHIDHEGRSEWIWAVPALTFAVTAALFIVTGARGGTSPLLSVPASVVIALVVAGLSVAYMTPEAEEGDDGPDRREPAPQAPRVPFDWSVWDPGHDREPAAPPREGARGTAAGAGTAAGSASAGAFQVKL